MGSLIVKGVFLSAAVLMVLYTSKCCFDYQDDGDETDIISIDLSPGSGENWQSFAKVNRRVFNGDLSNLDEQIRMNNGAVVINNNVFDLNTGNHYPVYPKPDYYYRGCDIFGDQNRVICAVMRMDSIVNPITDELVFINNAESMIMTIGFEELANKDYSLWDTLLASRPEFISANEYRMVSYSLPQKNIGEDFLFVKQIAMHSLSVDSTTGRTSNTTSSVQAGQYKYSGMAEVLLHNYGEFSDYVETSYSRSNEMTTYSVDGEIFLKSSAIVDFEKVGDGIAPRFFGNEQYLLFETEIGHQVYDIDSQRLQTITDLERISAIEVHSQKDSVYYAAGDFLKSFDPATGNSARVTSFLPYIREREEMGGDGYTLRFIPQLLFFDDENPNRIYVVNNGGFNIYRPCSL